MHGTRSTAIQPAFDATAPVRDKGLEAYHTLTDKAREAKLDELAREISERVRDSETLLRARAASKVLASEARSKSHELATAAAERLRDAELDTRATELAHRLRDSDAADRTAVAARRVTDEALGRVGGWLGRGPLAEKLGLQPKRRSGVGRILLWLVGLAGVGVGVAVVRSKRHSDPSPLANDFVDSAQQLTEDTTDAVRRRLGDDARTAELVGLSVNVANGTVFVRGTVPAEFDQETLRSVILAVPGVHDVDVQVTAGV